MDSIRMNGIPLGQKKIGLKRQTRRIFHTDTCRGGHWNEKIVIHDMERVNLHIKVSIAKRSG